ncbi:hypothetical protein Naga_100222g9 [Nannochloropsis gaditana]|uniref:Uncharacterized protein n=1 Tax=Nannochloropsis gaditana TaxID=72520 RepID=W7THX5_9STRA|nr:hypothetical protein Naga_100222g9 [Nannochloropsis gaditana]
MAFNGVLEEVGTASPLVSPGISGGDMDEESGLIARPKRLSRGVILAYRSVVEQVLPTFAVALQLDKSTGLSSGDAEHGAQKLKDLWLKAMKEKLGVDLGVLSMSEATLPLNEEEGQGGAREDVNLPRDGRVLDADREKEGDDEEEKAEIMGEEERRVEGLKVAQASRTFRWLSPPRRPFRAPNDGLRGNSGEGVRLPGRIRQADRQGGPSPWGRPLNFMPPPPGASHIWS